jgi:hypothetical protein
MESGTAEWHISQPVRGRRSGGGSVSFFCSSLATGRFGPERPFGTRFANDSDWSAGALSHQALMRLSDGQSGHRRMIMEKAETELTATKRQVWNAGRAVGAKRALKPKQIWEIRFYLNQRRRLRDRALFDLANSGAVTWCR